MDDRMKAAALLTLSNLFMTVVVFMAFAALWLGEGVQLRYLVSFTLVFAAVVVAFH